MEKIACVGGASVKKRIAQKGKLRFHYCAITDISTIFCKLLTFISDFVKNIQGVAVVGEFFKIKFLLSTTFFSSNCFSSVVTLPLK